MSSIDRLKEKIDRIKIDYLQLQEQYTQLLESMENSQSQNPDNPEADALRAELLQKDELVTQLRKELTDKDTEIDAIITKVESLISQKESS